jgi:hypothetical protein
MSRSAKVLNLVQPHLPGTVVCRDVLVVTPTDYVLRGFFLNSTSQKHHMDLWRVVMPLHRPLQYMVLNYSGIIPGPADGRIRVDDIPGAVEAVLGLIRGEIDALRRTQSAAAFLRHIARMSGNRSDVVQLDLALAHYLVGNGGDALRILRALDVAAETHPSRREIVQQALERIEADPVSLKTLIDHWRDENVATFGLAATCQKLPLLRLVKSA